MNKEQEIPWGEIGYITYKRTYARRLNEEDSNSDTEEFKDTVLRELKACKDQLNINFTEEEKQNYITTRMSLKWSVAGRFMWQLGTKTVDKLGLPSLQNCAFVTIDSPIRPFTWAFEMLMLGAGVGYNIQKEHVYQIPKVHSNKIKIQRLDEKDADYIVPDSREGWVKLLGKVLKSHFYSGEGFSFSTQLIRTKGAPIKGFGGLASGPEELCWGIEEISKLLNNRSGQKLRPIDCLDIMNIIGYVVVSGNVRRSAQIAIGDYDDLEFLKAKRWDLGNIPNWRAMSNNSVACNEISKLPSEFWDTYNEGEPYGLINLELSRKVGRTGDIRYPDPDVMGFNPCAEQSLNNFETCCLSEVYLPNITSYEELLSILRLTYRVNKHSLALKCSLKETEHIVNTNMRMGIGMTGILQATEEQRSWLKTAYDYIRAYDKEYSYHMKWPISIKITTCKPSGTLSLLPGVTPGVHPNPAGPYYIRRIRISTNSPLIHVCKLHGYHIEPQINFDGSEDKSTMVVEFPCKVPEGTPIASDYSWKEQLEMVRRIQAEWSDNSVSCTVYYKKEDLNDIKQYLNENYKDNFKTLSFLLYHGHGFKQAPYETISKEKYEELVVKTKPITSVQVSESDFEITDCDNGSCPIK
jgi:adenosylcobalamin-dependent ribonucleoside-triphosphate reductase